MKTEKFDNLKDASNRAFELSKITDYVQVIMDRFGGDNNYYVEQEPTMIRSWESKIIEYIDGKLITH